MSALGLISSTAAASQPDANITGGTDALECAFPAVARLGTADSGSDTIAYLCTGTLIHPRVMIYAAHCKLLLEAAFGTTGEGGVITGVTETATKPDYNAPSEEDIDWAYALFAEDVTNVPLIPIAAGCELAALQTEGHEVYLAGFSPNTAPVPPLNGLPRFAESLLRWTTSTLQIVDEGVLQAGGDNKHACGGDSGGPLLAQLSDGTWRTIGITSTIYGTCAQSIAYNHWSRVRQSMIDWIESETGVDVTPCFDGDGNYEAGPECDAFMAYAGDPVTPLGDWDDGCAEEPIGWAGGFCEVSGGDDTDTGATEEPEDTTAPEETTSEAPDTSETPEIPETSEEDDETTTTTTSSTTSTTEDETSTDLPDSGGTDTSLPNDSTSSTTTSSTTTTNNNTVPPGGDQPNINPDSPQNDDPAFLPSSPDKKSGCAVVESTSDHSEWFIAMVALMGSLRRRRNGRA